MKIFGHKGKARAAGKIFGQGARDLQALSFKQDALSFSLIFSPFSKGGFRGI